ncbi:DUF1566 domain-containing protein [Paraburkholderia pallida]|uniref:DUF1566 domain-containing protein n=1 Tax=Paraburkholderia pallida TaxID=2547399 RepID=A0A4P7CYK4_9BURK|nr:DUF1566 domain-containing protein [Paraburkholderia pallida]QBQ99221.1 DUF1566 domain-containing protein [Paraburkholderia pallida]
MSHLLQAIQLPELQAGEIYVGIIGDQSGNLHHVILLPGERTDVNWKDAKEWAASIGGSLPNRIEQAMLWARCRDQFEPDWYWSEEVYERNSGWAWSQDFRYGTQSRDHQYYELRARAVRRLSI